MYLIGGVDEEGRQWENLVLRTVQSKVAVALSEALDWDNTMSGNVVRASVKYGESQKCQIDKFNLFPKRKKEWNE